MDLEIRHLKMIRAIWQEGGVTRAADKLHLTQSALSHQLREIEDRLQASLFRRLNKKMILTEAGQKLLASAQNVLSELEKTEESIRKLAAGQTGVLRIATECNTCYYWLPSMLQLFQAKHPGVEIQVVVEATHRPIEALLEGKLDLAIAYSKITDKNLVAEPLFEDEQLVVMAPDHPLAAKQHIQAHDFADVALIVYTTPLNSNQLFQKLLMPAGVTPRKVYQVMLTEAIIEMVRAGMGVAVMARWAVAPYLKSGQLKAVRLTKKGIFRRWQAVMCKMPATPSYYGEFVHLLGKNALPVIPLKK